MASEPGTEWLACDFPKSRDALYPGHGTSHPLAPEGALRLKEISSIRAEGYAGRRLKHGPTALIDEPTALIDEP